MDFLRLSFIESARWAMTTALLAGGMLLYQPRRAWRLRIVLALSYVVVITPYIMRLYLTPPGVNYHITYVLSGRVFYLAFVILALILGGLAAWLQRVLQARRIGWLAILLPLAAYFHALFFVYERTDFLGLQVIRGASPVDAPPMPPRWNPYVGSQPFWLVPAVLLVVGLASVRYLAERKPDISFYLKRSPFPGLRKQERPGGRSS